MTEFKMDNAIDATNVSNICSVVLDAFEKEKVSCMSIGMAVKFTMKALRDNIFEMPEEERNDWICQNTDFIEGFSVKHVWDALTKAGVLDLDGTINYNCIGIMN